MAKLTVALIQAFAEVPNLSDVGASAFLSGILVLLLVLIAEIWSWAHV